MVSGGVRQTTRNSGTYVVCQLGDTRQIALTYRGFEHHTTFARRRGGLTFAGRFNATKQASLQPLSDSPTRAYESSWRDSRPKTMQFALSWILPYHQRFSVKMREGLAAPRACAARPSPPLSSSRGAENRFRSDCKNARDVHRRTER